MINIKRFLRGAILMANSATVDFTEEGVERREARRRKEEPEQITEEEKEELLRRLRDYAYAGNVLLCPLETLQFVYHFVLGAVLYPDIKRNANGGANP